jgi:ribonuclease BN (tRNA processing enzyme)
VRLTVVGCSPSWPNPGEACSSYLVETGGGSLLLDCGNGSLGRLRALRDAGPDAIVLSHLHPDHISDLWSVMFGITYGTLGWTTAVLYAPPGGRVVLAEILDAWGLGLADLERALPVREYRTSEPLVLPAATLTFARTRHSAHSYAIRVESGGRVLLYTGDAALDETLIAHAAGCHLLLSEATMADAPIEGVNHMSAADAAHLAAAAGAGRLVLTHVPAEHRDRALAAASEGALLALPDAVFDV